MRQGFVVAVLAGLVLATEGSAGATGVAPSPKKVSGAFAATSACGSLSGLGIAWWSTANVVTSVVLSSIPSACVGGLLSLTLVNSSNASLAGVASVTLTGTTQTLSSLTGSAVSTSVTKAY